MAVRAHFGRQILRVIFAVGQNISTFAVRKPSVRSVGFRMRTGGGLRGAAGRFRPVGADSSMQQDLCLFFEEYDPSAGPAGRPDPLGQGADRHPEGAVGHPGRRRDRLQSLPGKPRRGQDKGHGVCRALPLFGRYDGRCAAAGGRVRRTGRLVRVRPVALLPGHPLAEPVAGDL